MTDPTAEPSVDPSVIVLLVAHGSRADEANDHHRDQARALGHRLGVEVRPAFLELAEPSIPDAVDAAAADAATVVVLPHFLHAGRHVRDHIPELVEAAARRHPHRRVVLTAAFGDDPGVLDLLDAQVRRALADQPAPG